MTIDATIQGVDLGTMFVEITSFAGWLSGYASSVPTVPVPGRTGVVVLSSQPVIEPREITITGRVHVVLAADMEDAVRALTGLCGTGLVTIALGHDLTKFARGRLTRSVVTAFNPQLVTTYAALVLTFRCDDPRIYAATETTLTPITTTPVAVPLGNVPASGVFRVTGAVTDPLWTYKNHAGATIGTMGVTGVTLPGGADYIEWDTENLTVKKSVASVITSIPNTLVGDFLVIDPADALPLVPTWPTLQVSVGSGRFVYREAWQ